MHAPCLCPAEGPARAKRRAPVGCSPPFVLLGSRLRSVGILCYVGGSLLALPAAWLLPVEALRRKVMPAPGLRGGGADRPESRGLPGAVAEQR